MGHHALSSFWLLATLPFLFDSAGAACECGYSMTIGSNERVLFTDLLENDFAHLDIMAPEVQYGEYGWAAQVFDRNQDKKRGPFGESYTRENVVSNDIVDSNVFTGPGQAGPDAGLRLVVNSEITNNVVSNGEVATTTLNYLYGSYRASMKITPTAGTCSAFFWYYNDTQEIDIEFLSSEFNRNNNSFPVNLVLQSPESNNAGHDASGTKDFKTVNLPFDPTSDFHEYRFDWLADKVIFYADGQILTQMEGSSVPTEAGHVLLSHWSNGNNKWSGGPPTENAITTVSYVKSYFNSSLEARQNDFAARCTNPAAANAVCAIPNNDPTYFFTKQENMAPNQTIYSDDNAGEHLRTGWSLLIVTVIASSMWVIGL